MYVKNPMARRTKEESAHTRERLIAAAREAFERHGYARTTLEQVARAAGLTRGAFYFHFADKAALFRAMRDQVELPLIDRIGLELFADAAGDALLAIERFMLAVMAAIGQCETTRRTLEILSFCCEYVDTLEPELELQRRRHAELHEQLHQAYRRAGTQGLLGPAVDPALAALESTAFLSGLVRMWLLDRRGELVGPDLAALIHAHVESRRTAA